MARRRRSKFSRQKPINVRFVLFQIVVLLGVLFVLFAVQDTIGEGTGVIFDSLAPEDVEIERPVHDGDADDFPGERTDDGAGDPSEASDETKSNTNGGEDYRPEEKGDDHDPDDEPTSSKNPSN